MLTSTQGCMHQQNIDVAILLMSACNLSSFSFADLLLTRHFIRLFYQRYCSNYCSGTLQTFKYVEAALRRTTYEWRSMSKCLRLGISENLAQVERRCISQFRGISNRFFLLMCFLHTTSCITYCWPAPSTGTQSHSVYDSESQNMICTDVIEYDLYWSHRIWYVLTS